MKIYVGQLSPETTEEDLRSAFAAFGQVASVAVIKDRLTDQPRGFGFVEMPSQKEAQAAINGVREIKGRALIVNEARPREPGGRPPGPRRGNW